MKNHCKPIIWNQTHISDLLAYSQFTLTEFSTFPKAGSSVLEDKRLTILFSAHGRQQVLPNHPAPHHDSDRNCAQLIAPQSHHIVPEHLLKHVVLVPTSTTQQKSFWQSI